ncbi:MAG: tetratricopeptide repeat protein [Betaproteobacteria bacterium]|nr:tetratricopeptide repeat protein [Betaproteobacteria bacterium]
MLLERSRLYAARAERPRLIRPWLILGLGGLVMLLLALIYPMKTLKQRLITTTRGDPLAVSYLTALLRTDPDNGELRLMLARHLLASADLSGANAMLEPVLHAESQELRADALWLRVRLLEKRMDGVAATSFAYREAARARRDALAELARLPLPEVLRATVVAKLAAPDPAPGGVTGAGAETAPQVPAIPAAPPPALPSSPLELAVAALAQGDYDQAARHYLLARDAATTREVRRQHYMAAVRALQSGNRVRDALRLAENELKDLGNDRETLLFLVELARAANRPDVAEKYIRRLLKLSLWQQYQRVLAGRGPFAADGPVLLRVAETTEPAALPARFDERVYGLAWDVFLGNRKLEDAYRLASSAVRQVPGSLLWRERLARVSDWTNRPREALDNWLVLARRGGSEEAWSAVLRLAPGLLDDEALLAGLQHRLQRGPTDRQRVSEIVGLYERLGRPREALAFLRRAGGSRPDAGLLEEMALLAERAGEDDEALALWRRLIARDGATAQRAVHLATLLLIRGHIADAFAVLEQARGTADEGDATFWRLHARVARVEDEDHATQAYERLVARELAEDADYDALVAMLRADRPLRAAQVAAAGWRRFHKPNHLLLALDLLAAEGEWQAMARLLAEVTPQQMAVLEKRSNFLHLRAQHHVGLGQANAAKRDLELALALEPQSRLLRQAMIWLLADTNDGAALRLLLQLHEREWAADPQMHDALAGARLALSEPQAALGYLAPQLRQRRRDFLWMMLYADALEQNGEADRAWLMRQQLWRERAADRPAMVAGIKPAELERLRRAARARLVLAGDPGDASMAVLRELLRADAADPRAYSAAAREVVLAWWQDRGEYAAEARYLWQYYARSVTRPLWAEITVALESGEVEHVGELLERYAERLPRYDRARAAVMVGDPALSASLAAASLDVQPFDDVSHQQLTEVLLDQGHIAGLGLATRQVGGLDEVERSARVEARLHPHAHIGADTGTVSRRRNSDAVFNGVPGHEAFADAWLRVRHNEGETRLGAGRRRAMDTYRPLELSRSQEFSRRVQLTAALGTHLPAPETELLRMAGMKDRVSLGAVYRLSRLDRISAQWNANRYRLQSEQPVGSGRDWTLEYTHSLRTDLPEIEASALVSSFSFHPRGGYATDPRFVRYGALLAADLRVGLGDPAAPADVLATLDTNFRGVLPTSFRLYGVRLASNTRLAQDYTRGWRPFGSVAFTHNSVTGSGFGVALGLAGSVLGSDHLQVGWSYGRGGSASVDRTHEIGVTYRLYF